MKFFEKKETRQGSKRDFVYFKGFLCRSNVQIAMQIVLQSVHLLAVVHQGAIQFRLASRTCHKSRPLCSSLYRCKHCQKKCATPGLDSMLEITQ